MSTPARGGSLTGGHYSSQLLRQETTTTTGTASTRSMSSGKRKQKPKPTQEEPSDANIVTQSGHRRKQQGSSWQADEIVTSVGSEFPLLQRLLPRVSAPRAPMALLDLTHRKRLTALYPFFDQRQDLIPSSGEDTAQFQQSRSLYHEGQCAPCQQRANQQWTQLWNALLKKEYDARACVEESEHIQFDSILETYVRSAVYNLGNIKRAFAACERREGKDRRRLERYALAILAALARRARRRAAELGKRRHTAAGPMVSCFSYDDEDLPMMEESCVGTFSPTMDPLSRGGKERRLLLWSSSPSEDDDGDDEEDYSYAGPIELRPKVEPTQYELFLREERRFGEKSRVAAKQLNSRMRVETHETNQRCRIESEERRLRGPITMDRIMVKEELETKEYYDALATFQRRRAELNDTMSRRKADIIYAERHDRFLLDDELTVVRKAQKAEYVQMRSVELVTEEETLRDIMLVEVSRQWDWTTLSVCELMESSRREQILRLPDWILPLRSATAAKQVALKGPKERRSRSRRYSAPPLQEHVVGEAVAPSYPSLPVGEDLAAALAQERVLAADGVEITAMYLQAHEECQRESTTDQCTPSFGPAVPLEARSLVGHYFPRSDFCTTDDLVPPHHISYGLQFVQFVEARVRIVLIEEALAATGSLLELSAAFVLCQLFPGPVPAEETTTAEAVTYPPLASALLSTPSGQAFNLLPVPVVPQPTAEEEKNSQRRTRTLRKAKTAGCLLPVRSPTSARGGLGWGLRGVHSPPDSAPGLGTTGDIDVLALSDDDGGGPQFTESDLSALRDALHSRHSTRGLGSRLGSRGIPNTPLAATPHRTASRQLVSSADEDLRRNDSVHRVELATPLTAEGAGAQLHSSQDSQHKDGDGDGDTPPVPV